MKASLKHFAGAAVAVMALATVACGKSGGNKNNNTNGVNCVQVGATCVATQPGYISSGTWSGQIYNSNSGPVTITVRLTPNGAYGNGGYGGGYGGGGYYGGGYGTGYQNVGAVQTIATVSIRTQTAVISGTGIATGSAGGFSTVISTQYGQINVNGNFVDSTQRAMNIATAGQITVGGLITGNPDNSNLGGGYGYGGGNYGGNYGYGGNVGYGYGYGY